jgi:chromosome segregation ATPase
MRVAPPPAGSFSDDSDGDAGAWPLAASTSRRRDASDDADDLRQMLDAAEAARAALREVASSAAAEREMAFEARDAANAERDLLRGELEPLRASLAEATRALAQRDDETRSLRFKLDQLLRHARERDRVTTATRPSSDRIEKKKKKKKKSACTSRLWRRSRRRQSWNSPRRAARCATRATKSRRFLRRINRYDANATR